MSRSHKRQAAASSPSLPESADTAALTEARTGQLTPVPLPTPAGMLEVRREIRQDMTDRLASMLATMRSGLRAELAEAGADLRDATLTDLGRRLTELNSTMDGPVNPILKPSLRGRLRELTGVLSGLFAQMLMEQQEAGSSLDAICRQATTLAEETVRELVPNAGKVLTAASQAA